MADYTEMLMAKQLHFQDTTMTLANGYFLNQGRYQVQAPLGRGGMGTVYRAVDHNLAKRVVAIKENIDTDANSQQQFLQEALMLASLAHPNLPRVTDRFIEPSKFQYLVMDYIEGYNLDQIVQKRGGPIPERNALAWIEQIMNALEYMHTWPIKNSRQSAPIIHRDIKPSNIKRRRDGRGYLSRFRACQISYRAGDLHWRTWCNARLFPSRAV